MNAVYKKDEFVVRADASSRGDAVLRKLGYKPEHEIYNETKRQQRIAKLKVWLAERKANGLA